MERFGHYELTARLASGGMAEVFRARDVRTGKAVALKRILPAIAEDDEFVAMFLDEARIASALEHPHIARLLEAGETDGHFFIAFELVEGKELRALFDHASLSGERPPLAVVLHILARIGEGLSYAHARKDATGAPRSIVHRDVSPQNILVSHEGDVKLIDFGIAKAAGKIARTGAGTLKGKFGYMSPEQVQGKEVDARTDVFSLGVCMWELLTLRRLFAAGHEILVLDMVKNHVPEPPSVLVPSLPRDLDEIARKALAKSPDERYGSAREFHRDLYAFIESSGLHATRDEVARYMRRAFPSGSSPPGPKKTTQGGIMQLQETRRMSDENKGSDLDIFEGLGKKGAPSPRSSGAPPPPPGSVQPPTAPSGSQAAAPPAPPPPPAEMKKTLMGVAPAPVPPAPPTTPTGSGAPPPAASTPPPLPPSMTGPPAAPTSGSMRAAAASKPPPPPPGRGSLPALAAAGPTSQPPQAAATPSATVRSAPPPVSGRAIPAASPSPAPSSKTPSSSRQLDMDWDDDDEATHVFDKESRDREKAADPAVPERASMEEILSRPPPPPPTPAAGSGSNGALGQLRSAPPPSQSMRSAPPPPPASVRTSDRPSGSAFARASGASAEPGPVSPISGPPPPPPGQTKTAPMVMPGGSTPPHAHPQSVPPQPAAGSLPPTSMHPSAPPAASVPPQLPPVSRNMEATAMVPRQQQSKAGLYAALVLLVALVAGAAVFLLMPRTGNLVINVADSKGGAVSKMEVWVDGTKRCDSAPCIVREISAGLHEVKVVAPGYDPAAPRAVTVSSRQDATTDFTLVAASRMGGTGFKVTGTQPGVKLWVDGKEIGPLPQDLRDLSPGDHTLRFAASDRYAALEKTVKVNQDEIQDLGNVSLKVLKGKATITLGTPGAKVQLVTGTDRRELPSLPISVELDAAKPWTLEATKLGMADYREEISFEDGQAEKSFNVTLQPKGAPTPPAPVAAPQTPAPAPKPVAATPPATTGETPAAKPTAEKPAPKPAAAGGEAFLNINSLPASTVVLDGRPLGPTPKLKVSVPPGNHTVMFVNAELKLKKTISVSVAAGETKAAFAKLRD